MSFFVALMTTSKPSNLDTISGSVAFVTHICLLLLQFHHLCCWPWWPLLLLVSNVSHSMLSCNFSGGVTAAPIAFAFWSWPCHHCLVLYLVSMAKHMQGLRKSLQETPDVTPLYSMHARRGINNRRDLVLFSLIPASHQSQSYQIEPSTRWDQTLQSKLLALLVPPACTNGRKSGTTGRAAKKTHIWVWPTMIYIYGWEMHIWVQPTMIIYMVAKVGPLDGWPRKHISGSGWLWYTYGRKSGTTGRVAKKTHIWVWPTMIYI